MQAFVPLCFLSGIFDFRFLSESGKYFSSLMPWNPSVVGAWSQMHMLHGAGVLVGHYLRRLCPGRLEIANHPRRNRGYLLRIRHAPLKQRLYFLSGSPTETFQVESSRSRNLKKRRDDLRRSKNFEHVQLQESSGPLQLTDEGTRIPSTRRLYLHGERKKLAAVRWAAAQPPLGVYPGLHNAAPKRFTGLWF